MNALDDITDRHPGNTHYRFELTLHAGEEQVEPLRIETITNIRDYESKFSDVLTVDCLMGAGDLAYALQPHRDTLIADLFQIPVKDLGGGDANVPINYRRYRAVLLDKDSPAYTDSRPHASDRNDLNQHVAEVHLQLIEEAVYQLRMMTIGRIYRQMSPMDVLQTVLTEVKDWPKVNEEDRIQGVDIIPGFQTKKRETTIIPPTRVSKVVDVLQHDEGGLYATGVGNYLQDRLWYVYPLFDTTRADKEEGLLTIYRLPPNRAMGIERTFAIETNGAVDIIAGGSVEVIDAGRDQQLNHGNAMRLTNADQMLTAGEVKDNKFTANRRQNVFEVKTPVGEDPLTNAQWSPRGASSNPFPEYSRLAERNGQYLVVEWNHSIPDVLRPGMPVVFYAPVDNVLKRIRGTLAGINHQYVPGKEGAAINYYAGRALLKIFVERTQ